MYTSYTKNDMELNNKYNYTYQNKDFDTIENKLMEDYNNMIMIVPSLYASCQSSYKEVWRTNKFGSTEIIGYIYYSK